MYHVFTILYNNHLIHAFPIFLEEIDKTKCSKLFLERHLPTFKPHNSIFVKCDVNGKIDYRKRAEDKLEYRILNPKKMIIPG